MIESPKNFIEQFQNFIEHIAGVMNGLVSSKKTQTFTPAEKKQARDNIEAVSLNDLSSQFNNKINLTGDRGQLAGYENCTETVSTINDNSPDNGIVVTNVTVSDGSVSKAWVKVYLIGSSTLSVSLGSNWAWANGETPNIAHLDFLVCAWSNTTGIVTVVKRSA